MNFFKSIFSDDPDPPEHENPHNSDSNSPLEKHDDGDRSSNDAVQDESAGAWGFGGLIKSLATRSESVIEIYRKDLQEFGSGLKKETDVLREVASLAVKDLPTSLEAGASAAQGVLDGVLKSTADIISKETSVFTGIGESETPETNQSLNSGRYSWFDSQLSAIQNDLNTFCNEPEDVEEYRKWKSGFKLEDKREEIEGLMIGDNVSLDSVYEKVVPSVVDHETFWCRYFYKVDKLEQQEKVRANLVRRAISVDDDEDFSWDVEDEDEGANVNDQTGVVKVKGGDVVGNEGGSEENPNPIGKQEDSNSASQDDGKGNGNLNVDDGDNNNGTEESSKSSENVSLGEEEVLSKEVTEVKSDENVKSEGSGGEKNDENVSEESKGESCTKSDAAVGSSIQSKVEDEEDLGWDEIEDMGSGDEKMTSATGSTRIPNRADLRKRLSAEEDDEDLNWDIEDDDEPVKG